MTSIIVADQLTKWYGPRRAVDGVSFEVRAGEVMGLLGPNGSGKTTILRILTGYLRPSSGTARIAGLDIVDDALAVKRRIGYVPEDAPLYDTMRVREFLEFMARIKGLARGAVPAAVGAACARLALAPVVGLQIGKPSKGFRQRVAIAQALLGSPEVLILDEPGNGLDPRQIIEMRELIRSLAGSLTVLVTSHILGEIERVADRVAILLGGRLLAVHALRAGGATRRLRLQVRGEDGPVRSCLGRVRGVGAIALAATSRDDARTYLVDTDGPAVAEGVAAALVGAGFGLVELHEDAIDLEALFLQLTGGAPASARHVTAA